MKRLIGLLIAILVLASVGAVAYKMGWLAKVGLGVGGPTTAALNRPGAGPQGGEAAAPGAPPAASASGEAPAGGANAGEANVSTFDGNIAAQEWGGRMESATGLSADDEMSISRPLRGKETPMAGKDANEFVISFFGREPALVDRVEIVATENVSPRDTVEVWVSTAGPATGFARVATETLPGPQVSTIGFSPVEARFVKLRVLGEPFNVNWYKVYEAQRAGYVPLLTRRPEIVTPVPAAAATATPLGAMPACAPEPAVPPPAGKGQSRKVLVVSNLWVGPSTEGGSHGGG